MSLDPAVSAVRRADQAFCEQLARAESIEFALAYASSDHPLSASANQLREITLGGMSVDDAYETCERWFGQHGLTCRRWSPALNEPIEPYDAFLLPRGWTRRDRLAMAMVDWPAIATPDPSVHVVPARAMRRSLRATLTDPDAGGCDAAMREAYADECIDRLNDANYEMFVGIVSDQPAGRIAYHEVGDIAAVRDLFVVTSLRGRGVGRALLAHLILMARRLSPRVLVCSVDAGDARARRFFERNGFRAIGRLPEYERDLA